MKTLLVCPECAQRTHGVANFFAETIRQDGLYTGQCPNGHELLIATQTLPHEMLFEIALNAVEDGYYREAVSSFAASVERFYEFAIRVLARNRKVTPSAVEVAWKHVAAQSERQLGAYIFLYVVSFGELPTLIDCPMTALRNSVIHKGLLPERRDATQYGAAAYEVIQPGLQKLRASCLDDVNAILGERVDGIAQRMGSKYPRSFQVTTTALNVIDDISQGYKPFEQIVRGRGLSMS